MKRRVVITGIGPATAIGIGKNEFFKNLTAMKTNISEIPSSYEEKYPFKSRYFVPKPDFDLKDYGIHRGTERLMEETSRLSVLCTMLALEDAKFKYHKVDKYFETDCPNNSMIILGVGMSSLQTAFDSYIAHLDNNNDSKSSYNRMVIPMLMPNSTTSWLSIIFGLKGINYTMNASCASGSYAIGEAYNNILSGRCEVAITGGVECLAERTGSIMRGFDMLTALTKSNDGKPLPFSNNRSGFLFNEGAGCVLILEELQHAINRGADIYAEIIDYNYSSDAYNILQINPSGENIKRLFEETANNINIDYLNAHGTATLLNDDVEAKVIQRFFGDKDSQPYINSTKGILGHSLAASGALEAAVTAMSIKNSIIHGNLTNNTIANLNLPTQSIKYPIKYALSTSYGFGGHNALLLFKEYDKDE